MDHSSQSSDKALLDAASAFAPELAMRAAEIEKNRYLPHDIAARFAEAGFYRLLVPRAYGGYEVHPARYLEIIERLARADGSSAWCAFIGATSGLLSAFLTPDVAGALFGDASIISAGVFAPRGKAVAATENGISGYRVSGRWQWGSGSRNASLIAGGALICDEAGAPVMNAQGIPENRMMIFPADGAILHDTWDVSGLCGTGSTDFEVQNIFVPATHSVSLFTDKPVPVPLYCFPTFGLLGIGIAAVALGIAEAAIDEVISLAAGKTPQGSAKPLALRAKAQNDVSEAVALRRSARAFLMETIDAAWEAALRDGQIDTAYRRDLRLATTHATRSAARAVDLMYTLAGGSSVYRSSPLQRQFRDVHVTTQHMMVSDATYELTGRLLLGVPTDTAML